MSQLTDKVTELVAEVADLDAGVDSIVGALDGLFAIIQTGIDTGDITQVQAAIDAAKAKKQAIVDAIQRDTPPAPAKPAV